MYLTGRALSPSVVNETYKLETTLNESVYTVLEIMINKITHFETQNLVIKKGS